MVLEFVDREGLMPKEPRRLQMATQAQQVLAEHRGTLMTEFDREVPRVPFRRPARADARSRDGGLCWALRA